MITFRPYIVASVCTVIAVALLISLGQWQLKRLAWKEGLIAAVEARAQGEPVPVLGALNDVDELEYRRVSATGRFDHQAEVYLFSQLEDKRIGFQVITPLVLPSGDVLLVDRGFVAQRHRDPTTRLEGQVEGLVSLTGLLRTSQPSGMFTPAPDDAQQVVYSRDVPVIASLSGVDPVAPILLAADDMGIGPPAPEGGHTRLKFKNDHLAYALTWFALAATLIGVYLAYHWQTGRLTIGRR